MSNSRIHTVMIRTVAAIAIGAASFATPVSAQTVEIVPLGGYRFGGDFFERTTNRPVDLDGAPAIGGAVNVALGNGLWFEALFTRQEARVTVEDDTSTSVRPWRIHVDHWQAGGRQDFGNGRVRPFLTGLLGLTRYAGGDESEVRFTIGAGGGVKLGLTKGLGARFDSRVFTTFVDGDATGGFCSPGLCVVGLHLDVLWQLEFSAGVVFGF
jgi:hypothetical protein